MTDLSAKFATLEAQLTTQHTAVITALNSANSSLSMLVTTLDIINENASANTQAILAAIAANGACSPCAAPPLTGTPPISTVGPINADKCRRVQGLLHTIGLYTGYADAPGIVTSAFTPAFFTAVVGEVRTSSSDTGIPVPAWIDTLLIASDGVNYLINKALLGGSISSEFAGLLATLQAELFAASSPSAAKTAYDSTIDGASISAWSKPLLKALGYSDLFNYYLDTGSSPAVSGYDGSLCGLPSGCLEFGASDWVTVSTEDGPKTIPDWSIYGIAVASNPGHDNAVWVNSTWGEWSWTVTGGTVYHEMIGVGGTGGTSASGAFPAHSGSVQITFILVDGTPTLEFCPPGS